MAAATIYSPEVDPIIAGLLKGLLSSGEVWPKQQRKLWLQLLEGGFDLIYKDNDVMQWKRPLAEAASTVRLGACPDRNRAHGGLLKGRNLFAVDANRLEGIGETVK